MSEFFMISSSPVVSGVFWFLLTVTALYLARTPAHYSIRSLTRAVHNAMRLSARSVREAEKRLVQRNKEVLLAQGREASERIIEREFDRIESTVRRDLAEYPAIHRQLHEEINHATSLPNPPAPLSVSLSSFTI